MCCANNYGLWKNFTKQNEDHYTDNGQAIQQQEHQVCTLVQKVIIYKSRGGVSLLEQPATECRVFSLFEIHVLILKQTFVIFSLLCYATF